MRKAYSVSAEALESFYSLRPMLALTYLNLDECVNMNDSVLVIVATNCPNLLRFSANWCQQLQSLGVKSVLNICRKLLKLRLIGIRRLPDEAFLSFLPPFSAPSALSNLRKLDLEACNIVSDDLLIRVKATFPHITIIDYFKNEVTL